MILTVEELRKYIDTEETDEVLKARLDAAELMVRGYTNNGFHVKGFGRMIDIVGSTFMLEEPAPYEVGDTVEVSGSTMNDGLFTVKEVTADGIRVNEKAYDEIDAYCTKVYYPADVKMGVVNLMKWELENRDKVGVQQETISRHSVTYFDMGADNSAVGYPKSLIGFLQPYMRARFGQGVKL